MSDFTKWAVIGYNDDTGIGNQLDAIKHDIGISKHLVIPSEKLKTKPLKKIFGTIKKNFFGSNIRITCTVQQEIVQNIMPNILRKDKIGE